MHGPPGTGKTFTAAAVIARLVTEHGWRVGVVAQSHATVENLLDAVIDTGLEPSRVAKKKYDHHAPRWQEIDGSEYAAFISATNGCVIGGTAWDFANANRVPPGSLDLLVIDEAGQFCLANTIAVAAAASNLLLLGDPSSCRKSARARIPSPSTRPPSIGWSTVSAHCPMSAATSWTCPTGCIRRSAPRSPSCRMKADCIRSPSAPPRASSSAAGPV